MDDTLVEVPESVEQSDNPRDEILRRLRSEIPHDVDCCTGCRKLLENVCATTIELQQALAVIRNGGVGALLGRGRKLRKGKGENG